MNFLLTIKNHIFEHSSTLIDFFTMHTFKNKCLKTSQNFLIGNLHMLFEKKSIPTFFNKF
jgi:hypothetical protein